MHDYERAEENKHLHMNKNNKNAKANFKTQNTLAMPETRTESSYVIRQEAQLSPKDRAMRRVIGNIANCHATVQKLLIRQVLTKSMV